MQFPALPGWGWLLLVVGAFAGVARVVVLCVAEMKSYGLVALAPLATTHPSPTSGRTGDPGVPGRGAKAISMANIQIKLLEFDPKNLPVG